MNIAVHIPVFCPVHYIVRFLLPSSSQCLRMVVISRLAEGTALKVVNFKLLLVRTFIFPVFACAFPSSASMLLVCTNRHSLTYMHDHSN
jgi:hypothetical protein